jgi:hypothetical protein
MRLRGAENGAPLALPSSGRERGWGEGRRLRPLRRPNLARGYMRDTFSYSEHDGFNQGSNVVAGITCLEADNFVTQIAQTIRAKTVLSRSIIVPVTVNFDHKICCRTCEVDDIGSDWMLTSKLEARYASAAQRDPQSVFEIGLSLPQGSGSCDFLRRLHTRKNNAGAGAVPSRSRRHFAQRYPSPPAPLPSRTWKGEGC